MGRTGVRILVAEFAYRIKNSLQIIISFVAYEIRQAAEPCIAGYQAIQTRIGAVAGLYDVISRSASLGPVPVGPYLEGVAASLRSSLLGAEDCVSACNFDPVRRGIGVQF